MINKKLMWILLPISLTMLLLFTIWASVQELPVYGIEVVQKLMIAVVATVFEMAFVWMLIDLAFPNLAKFVKEDQNEKNSWNGLNDALKVQFGFWLFAALLLTFSLNLGAI